MAKVTKASNPFSSFASSKLEEAQRALAEAYSKDAVKEFVSSNPTLPFKECIEQLQGSDQWEAIGSLPCSALLQRATTKGKTKTEVTEDQVDTLRSVMNAHPGSPLRSLVNLTGLSSDVLRGCLARLEHVTTGTGQQKVYSLA